VFIDGVMQDHAIMHDIVQHSSNVNRLTACVKVSGEHFECSR